MEDRIVNGVFDRLFSRLSPEARGNSPPVSLPGVIQRIISNPVLQDVEGELRNRFNMHNSQQTTSTVARNPQQSSTPAVPGSSRTAPVATSSTPVPPYNPPTSYGRSRSLSSGRRRKRTIQNIFKDEPAEKITCKDLHSPWIKRNNYSHRQGEKQTGKGGVCGTCRTTKTKPNRGGN